MTDGGSQDLPEKRYCSKSSTTDQASPCEPAGDVGKYAFDPEGGLRAVLVIVAQAMLFLDRIKREKGVWWMPWQQEAMKDVIPCVKPWGAGNRL